MNSPTIRFAGFTEDWEERKLGEIAIEVTRKAEEGSVAPVMMISAASGFIDQSTKYSSDNAGSSLKNYTLLIEGELAYNHGYSKLRNFGSCFDLKVAEARIPFVYHAFSMPNDNPSFFAYYLNSGMFDGELKKRVSSSARMDGLLNISYAEYMSLKISRPNIAEQQKISELISKVDRLITLHQREHDKTVNIKKALLEKMFPKDGEDKPEIRFAGFTGAWESRKIGDLCCEFRSGEFIKASDISPSGDYPVYGGNGLRGYASFYNHDGDFALIGRQGALCGNMQFSCGKAYFTEHAVAVMANNNNNTLFLYYLLGTMNLGQYSGQSAQPGLAVGKLNALESRVPVKAEQEKISEFFTNLDRLITLHKRELTKLQNIKKALLEKMFV